MKMGSREGGETAKAPQPQQQKSQHH